MSVIATLVVPGDDFILGAALGADPGMRVELDRVVPVDDTTIPYFWASDDSVEDIETALRLEAALESFRTVDTTDGRALLSAEWAGASGGLLDAVSAAGATMLEGVGEGDVWRFRLRFDDHEGLTELYRRCVDDDIDVDLATVYDTASRPETGPSDELTPAQRETIQLALERGYFEVPRRITLVELADELGVSDSAVSQRLRRGVSSILSGAFRGPPSPDEGE